MNTMGESTRRRAAAAVGGGGDFGGGTRGGGREGFGRGPTVGGYGGGMGGTFGRAGTGRTGSAPVAPPPPPAGPGAGPTAPQRMVLGQRPMSAMPGGNESVKASPLAPGVRPKIRPSSAAVKHVWDNPGKFSAVEDKMRAQRANATAANTVRPVAAAGGYAYGGPSAATFAPYGVPMGGGGGGGGGGYGARPQTAHVETGDRPVVVFRETQNYPLQGELPPKPAQLPPRPAPSTSAAAALPPPGPRPLAAPSPAAFSALHLQELEEALRDALRSKRAMYEDNKQFLLKAFRSVNADGGSTIEPLELVNLGDMLGVRITEDEALALFAKHGCKTGVMAYDVFAKVLLSRPTAQLTEGNLPERKGAFRAGEKADFLGKIIYRQSRTGVMPPSDWDPTLAERSAQIPDARLRLEFVYGYDGISSTANNVFVNCDGRLVYYTAGVGIVYAKPPQHSQAFFLGHSDDIKCMDICRADGVRFNDKVYIANSLVATGQVTSTEEGAYVCIWDSRTPSVDALGLPEPCEMVQRIPFPKDARGIVAVSFSPDGELLTIVTMDNQHSVYIYDWRNRRCVSEGKGFSGEPPQVFGIAWNQHAPTFGVSNEFVTYGRKHIKRWSLDTSRNQWTPKQLSFGKFPLQNINSAAYLPPPKLSEECTIVAGTASGEIYVYRGGTCTKSIAAHKPGPQVTLADGSRSYEGLRAMRLVRQSPTPGAKVITTQDRFTLYSGGADGLICRWDVTNGDLSDKVTAGPSIQLGDPYAGAQGGKPPVIKALDVDGHTGGVIVGTAGCDLFEATDTTQEIFMDGHEGDLWGVAFHPRKPTVFASACESTKVFLWSTESRSVIRIANVGFKARCCTISPEPAPVPNTSTPAHHVAVGSANGKVVVVSEDDMRPIAQMKDVSGAISDLKYSPDGRYLAVASHDTCVDIYAVAKGYQRVARSNGHTSAVKNIDWSADSGCFQCDSQSYELLYFNPKTGKQVHHTMRDTAWATWTCSLGFPVMGIWPDGSDGTDINAVDRSPCGRFLVTSGDDGLVRLHNYPCVIEDAPYRAYRGHSSHVMCVRFSADGTRVCSVGGKDRSIFQFLFREIEPEAPPPPAPEPVWGPLDASGKAYGYRLPDASLDFGGATGREMRAIRESGESTSSTLVAAAAAVRSVTVPSASSYGAAAGPSTYSHNTQPNDSFNVAASLTFSVHEEGTPRSMAASTPGMQARGGPILMVTSPGGAEGPGRTTGAHGRDLDRRQQDPDAIHGDYLTGAPSEAFAGLDIDASEVENDDAGGWDR